MKSPKSLWTTIGLSLLAAVIAGGFVVVQVKAKPFVREVVETPIYAVGDAKLADALDARRRVTKTGPMPFGLYDGSRAFRSPQDARRFLHATRRDAAGWSVYELSGDFDLDTRNIDGEAHISRTLLVVRRVSVAD